MGKNGNRDRYNRDSLRYPGDLTDAEWTAIKSLIPPAQPSRPPVGVTSTPDGGNTGAAITRSKSAMVDDGIG